MTTLGFDLFIAHLETMKDDLQQFHTTHKDLPKQGFDEEHEDALRSGLKRIDHVMKKLQEIDRLAYKPFQEWFEYENYYLSSYHNESIDNYYHALMNLSIMFRSVSDLWHKLDRTTRENFFL